MAEPQFIVLEEAKRRLASRVGISLSSLQRGGMVRELRRRGRYLIHQHMTDGSVRLRCFRVPAQAVDEVATIVEGPSEAD